jgi:membrane-bound lytic murein transglycosylase B
VPDYAPASIVAPMGPAGAAFMVFPNFSVIGRYNNAENYMIGIGHLSDRLAGGPAIRSTFPPDARGMTIEDRKALQRGLAARGYDVGTPDGVIGSKTTDAISAYQASAGLSVTGEPSRELLASLR